MLDVAISIDVEGVGTMGQCNIAHILARGAKG